MELLLTGKNLYIANKKPQKVQRIESNGTELYIKNEENEILEAGKIDLGKDLYACLFCRQIKNITFIVQKETAFSTSLILAEEKEFNDALGLIRNACPTLEFSEQNAKINGYAASVVEKLQEGVSVKIMETKEEQSIKSCPVCGMQCDPNIPFCMECGAPV